MPYRGYEYTIVKDVFHDLYIGTVVISPVECELFYAGTAELVTQRCTKYIDSLCEGN